MAFQFSRRISRRDVPKKDVFIGAGGTYEGVVETTSYVQHVVVVSLVRLEQEVFERTVESDASIGGRTEENVVTIRVESDGSDGAGFRLQSTVDFGRQFGRAVAGWGGVASRHGIISFATIRFVAKQVAIQRFDHFFFPWS